MASTKTVMACPLSNSILYRAPPRNPCLDENVAGCSAQTFSDAPISSQAHRCVEQLCFSVGSCLLSPCDSLRPRPPLQALESSRRPCESAKPGDSLLCAYLSLDDYQLYYKHFDAGVPDCWRGLADTFGGQPEAYSAFRVWETLGYTDTPARATALYNEAFLDTIARD